MHAGVLRGSHPVLVFGFVAIACMVGERVPGAVPFTVIARFRMTFRRIKASDYIIQGTTMREIRSLLLHVEIAGKDGTSPRFVGCTTWAVLPDGRAYEDPRG
jgi:hypothetical protein